MKHMFLSFGAGIGLMAPSMQAGEIAGGAAKGLHGFGSAMLYVNPARSAPVYVNFIPQGNQDTDAVILLELTQSVGSAPSSWQYFVSRQNLRSAASGYRYQFTVAASAIDSWALSEPARPSDGTASPSIVSFWGQAGNGAESGGAGSAITSNGEVDMGFRFVSVVPTASVTCHVSFNAYIDNADYLQYWIYAISAADALRDVNDAALPSVLAAASAAWSMTTRSAGAAGDRVTGSYADAVADEASLPAWHRIFFPSGRGSFYTTTPGYTYASLLLSNAALSAAGTLSLGSESLAQIAGCQSIANARLALNSAGLQRLGMLRLW